MATKLELGGLTTRIVGPTDANTTVVLLHGFGAPGDDLVALADHISAPSVRWMFPEAPIELGGLYGDSRAWWMLDLAKLEDDLRRGVPRDRRDELPEGLLAVRAQVTRMLDEAQQRFAIANDRLMLGGFSQGAMVSLDVALHRAVPPAGLIVMSGTLLAQREWQPRMTSLAGVPVMQSHGRSDMLLPFSIAEQLAGLLRDAGAIVDWQPFAGGHEIPPSVLAAAGQLLRSR
ncbi:MAG: alpha/beta hydrolase [Kofleriaceae bacterium]